MTGGIARALFCLVLGLAIGCDADRAATPAESAGEPGAPAAFAARFVDTTEVSGLSFTHTNGLTDGKWLPETLGSGVALLDQDGDGHLDIFLVNSRPWNDDTSATSALYRGRGDGHFDEVTAETGAGVHRFGMGCSAADADADGDVDLFVTAVDGDVYLRNDGGRFVDATAEVGLSSRTWADADGSEIPEWSTASAWFDADGDGDLDLFVGHYCRWSPSLEIFTTLDGTTKAFTTPDRYEGLPCRLFFNDGTGHFAEGPARDDLEPHAGKALGVAIWDFDGDGRLDVVVANDTRPNFVFMNQGDGRFREAGLELGIAYDGDGRARAGMGIDIADPEVTGNPLVAIGNFAGEPVSLYRWNAEVGFDEIASESGLVLSSLATLAFGVAFFDADLDGRNDLLVVNGHIEPDIARFIPGQRYRQSAQLYRGRVGGFEEVTDRAGEALARPRVGRGLAIGDLDEDGDLDLVLTENGGPARILANQGLDPARSLRVTVRGTGRNPGAIGARVELEGLGRRQVRWVRTGSSYLSQSELTLTFGLGPATGTGTLKIRWPDGAEASIPVSATDRRRVIEHPADR